MPIASENMFNRCAALVGLHWFAKLEQIEVWTECNVKKKSICLSIFPDVIPLAGIMHIKKAMVKETKELCFYFAICTANRKKLKDKADVFHNLFSPVM